MAHNLERIGQNWVAYDAAGYAFRCVNVGKGAWRARPSHSGAAGDNRSFSAFRLRDLAALVGKSFPAPAPVTCPACGSNITQGEESHCSNPDCAHNA